MRYQGTGWPGPDADEMDDAECGGRAKGAKGTLTACSSGAGSDFRRQIIGGGRPEFSLARPCQTVG